MFVAPFLSVSSSVVASPTYLIQRYATPSAFWGLLALTNTRRGLFGSI